MRGAFSRLRWQLTLSHLAAIAVTLVSMLAAILLLATSWFAGQNSPAHEPVQDAWLVAQAAGGLVTRGESADLDGVLHALANGSLQVVTLAGPGPGHRPPWIDTTLHNVAYLAVLGPDGRLLGSSDPAGAAFSPPERAEWGALAANALAGENDWDKLVVIRGAGGPAALGAYPILDGAGRPAAVVLVATSTLPQPAAPLDAWRTLAIFGAASLAVLAAASLFALAASSLVAYLLSRRLVARLERLGRAVEAVAAGDLAARADAGAADELGQLARRFNAMAADLERTLRALETERDRVAGLLGARRQLVAAVSHELRTPVAIVRGYLEATLRRDGAVPADVRTDLVTMEREVERLQRLIEDLFTLSRAEVGQLELRPQPTDVAMVVRRRVDALAPLAWAQRRVQVLAEPRSAADLPPALADEQRLEQILSNLLGNAVRYTAPGGLVVAAVAAEPRALRIEVRDTGAGIAPEYLPHVFERFSRGRDDDGEGAGLGLALAKELAEAMGGSIEAASTPGEGSCFTVRLPLAEASARA